MTDLGKKQIIEAHALIQFFARKTLVRELSDEGLSRALAILNAAFKEIEKLGGSINDDLTMKIRQDVVGVNLAEG